ncbi:MAG: 50S ribosomal protein L23 [Deltaproteobacteria bacterium]|nr:50S ribosomal protein L23 [Deltaproteobacteria bacterium]
MDVWSIIEGRRITEKSTRDREEGKYVFIVHRKATKADVRKAVEKTFKVQVEKVNIMNIRGKRKVFHNIPGKRPDIRKAIVTLKQGQEIKDL